MNSLIPSKRTFIRGLLGLAFFSFQSHDLLAQRILPQVWFNENNISDRAINVGDQAMLYGLGSSVSEIKGDYFWEEKFQAAIVYFYPQQIKSLTGGTINLDSLGGVEIRFDLWNNNVEFKTDQEIKIISANKVSNVLIQDDTKSVSQFINPKEFQNPQTKGLFELLASKNGKAFLQSKEILLQRANYNPALDTGSKEPQITKKEHFHFWDGKKLTSIDNKKDVESLLGSFNLDAKKYLKESKNKLKEAEDFKKLAHFIFESNP